MCTTNKFHLTTFIYLCTCQKLTGNFSSWQIIYVLSLHVAYCALNGQFFYKETFQETIVKFFGLTYEQMKLVKEKLLVCSGLYWQALQYTKYTFGLIRVIILYREYEAAMHYNNYKKSFSLFIADSLKNNFTCMQSCNIGFLNLFAITTVTDGKNIC